MNVAIVEDHKILAESLHAALTNRPGICEVRSYFSGDSFLNAVAEWQPDLIIADLLMPGLSGAELIKTYRSQLGADIKIIVLSSHTRKADVRDVMEGGANCYLSKEESIEALIGAIHRVIEGETFVSDSIVELLRSAPGTETDVHLSPREHDVLRLVCSGRIMKEVAHELGLSVHTVQSYHNNMMRKFKVRRTSDLIIAAIRKGFYTP